MSEREEYIANLKLLSGEADAALCREKQEFVDHHKDYIARRKSALQCTVNSSLFFAAKCKERSKNKKDYPNEEARQRCCEDAMLWETKAKQYQDMIDSLDQVVTD